MEGALRDSNDLMILFVCLFVDYGRAFQDTSHPTVTRTQEKSTDQAVGIKRDIHNLRSFLLPPYLPQQSRHTQCLLNIK